ncbi:uncharacterized protein LOC135832406 isoform X1 [Planococcus citri]|uniref:uncharacterized protein LOC135832406 isoform X1 n=1 Tax=Planococcus citri TaxID=170843 RepID=UPI0031F839E5
MKVYFEFISIFLIIEIKTHAFITGDSENIRNLQEAKSTRNLLQKDLNQLINDELLEESYTLETPYQISTSLNELPMKGFQIQMPIEQTLEKNYYENLADNSNTAHSTTTENYFSQSNNVDGYKPLIYEDSRNTETPFEMLKGSSSNPPTSTIKPPSIPELPFGLPNGYSSNGQGSQTPTLIMGGFSILVMPMPGLTPGNMANMFQTGQQLGQVSGTNPFLGPYPATG